MTQADSLLVEFAGVFGQTPNAKMPDVQANAHSPATSPGTIQLVLKNRQCNARAIYDGGTVVVLSGSTLALNERSSLEGTIYSELRREMKRRGDLTIDSTGHALTLNTDSRFNSPSQAACVVVGYSANGKQVWKIEDTGKSLGEWLDSKRA